MRGLWSGLDSPDEALHQVGMSSRRVACWFGHLISHHSCALGPAQRRNPSLVNGTEADPAPERSSAGTDPRRQRRESFPRTAAPSRCFMHTSKKKKKTQRGCCQYILPPVSRRRITIPRPTDPGAGCIEFRGPRSHAYISFVCSHICAKVSHNPCSAQQEYFFFPPRSPLSI